MNNCEEFNLELFSSQLQAFDATIEQLESSCASKAWGGCEENNDPQSNNVDRILAASNLALKKSSQLSSSSSSSSVSFAKSTHTYNATPRTRIYNLPFQNLNHSNRPASNSHARHPCECDSCIDGPPPSLKDYNDIPMLHKSDVTLQDEINNSKQKILESFRMELEEVKEENRRLLLKTEDQDNEIAVLSKNLESAMRVNKDMKMQLNEYEIGATQSMLRSAKEFFVKTQVDATDAPSLPSSPSPPLSPLASTLEVEWDKE